MRYLVALAMIAIAAFARVLPHPPNFTPVTAIALFSAVYLDKRWAFVLPLIAMIASDYVIGMHQTIAWVYASLIAIGVIGLWLRGRRSIGATALATVGGSVLFFVVTNFGVWYASEITYPHTLAGLAACYTAAIPFFRNTLAGDAFFVTVLFGSYELLARALPALRPASTTAAR